MTKKKKRYQPSLAMVPYKEHGPTKEEFEDFEAEVHDLACERFGQSDFHMNWVDVRVIDRSVYDARYYAPVRMVHCISTHGQAQEAIAMAMFNVKTATDELSMLMNTFQPKKFCAPGDIIDYSDAEEIKGEES